MADWWDKYSVPAAAEPAASGNWWDRYAEPDEGAGVLGHLGGLWDRNAGALVEATGGLMQAAGELPRDALNYVQDAAGALGGVGSMANPYGPMNTLDQVAAASDARHAALESDPNVLTRVGRDVASTGEAISFSGQQDSLVRRPDSIFDEPLQAAGYYANEAAGSAVPLAIAIAAPEVGLPLFGAQAFGGEYDKRRGEGVDPFQSAGSATLHAAAEVIPESAALKVLTGKLSAPIRDALGRRVASAITTNPLVRAGAGAIAEGGSEVATQIAQDATDIGMGDDISLGQMGERAKDAFMAGAVLGGPLAGVHATAQSLAALSDPGARIRRLAEGVIGDRIQTPETDAIEAGMEATRGIFADVNAPRVSNDTGTVIPDPRAIDFSQQVDLETGLPPIGVAPESMGDLDQQLAGLPQQPVAPAESAPIGPEALLADLAEPELIRGGTRVFYAGDVPAMRARLAEAGLSEGMRKRNEDGSDAGLYFPARMQADVDAVLRASKPSADMVAQAEPVVKPDAPVASPVAEQSTPAPAPYEGAKLPPERKPRNQVRNAGDFDPNYHDIRDFIALNGGLDFGAFKSEFNSEIPGDNMRFFGKPLFRKNGGMNPDQLRELMQESGFLNQDSPDSPPQYTPQDAYDLVDRALDGQPVYHSQGVDTQNQIRANNEYDAEQERRQAYIDEHGAPPELDEEFAQRASALDRGDLERDVERIDLDSVREDTTTYGNTRQIPSEQENGSSVAEPGAADRKGRGPVSGSLDLFTRTRGQADEVQSSAPRLFQSAKVVSVGQFSSGVEKIRDWKDAAHVLAPLRKSPQEQMMAVVADADGKPIAILRHTMGLVDQSAVSPYTVFGAIAQIPGAKQVWFGHNHPSGSPKQSAADKAITLKLSNLMRGSGIQTNGMIVVSPGNTEATYFNSDTGNNGESPERITAAARKGSVPVVERVLRKIPAGDRLEVTSPQLAEDAVKQFGKESGVILLDSKNAVVGFLPMTEGEMAKVRTGDAKTGSARVMRAATEANAAAAITVSKDILAGQNVGGLLDDAGLRALDLMHVGSDGSINSMARAGRAIAAPVFYSKSAKPEIKRSQRPDSKGIEAEELTGDDAADAERYIADLRQRQQAELDEKDNPLTEGFKILAENPETFRNRLLPGKTIRELSQQSGTRYTGQSNEDGIAVHSVAVNQGKAGPATAKIYDDGKDVWIDVSGLKSGGGKGDAVYNMAFSYAKNNGRNFIEDPSGVSDAAMYRRPVQQLAMLLKAGTADNIAPGDFLSTQRPGGPNTRPIKAPANRAFEPTLRENILTTYTNALNAVPEVGDIRYDTDRAAFVDTSGKPVTDADFDRLASNRRADPVREAMVRVGDPETGQRLEPAPVGGNSLKVAALAQTLLRASPSERPALLDGLRKIASGSLGNSGLNQILPSKNKAPANAGVSVSGPAVTLPQMQDAVRKAFGSSKLLTRLLQRGSLKLVTAAESAKSPDIVAAAREAGVSPEEYVRDIKGYHASGQAHLITDNVTAAEVPGLLLHEVGVHHTMETILGKDLFAALQKRMGSLRSRGDKDVVRAFGQVPKDTPTKHVNHEAIAYLAEESPNHPISQKIIDGTKLFLNRLGIPMSWINAEGAAIRKIAKESLLAEARGEGRTLGIDSNGIMFQRVFHGTPHRDIEKDGFKLNKIGTGEGAQAYGYGMYFAGRREVAEGYRKNLTRGPERYFYDGELAFERNAAGAPFDLTNPRTAAIFYVANDGLAGAKKYLASQGSWGKSVLEALQLLDPKKIRVEKSSGQLYHAEIPEDSDLLDYDKPLSEQPEKVRDAVNRIIDTAPYPLSESPRMAAEWREKMPKSVENNRSMARFYRDLTDQLGAPALASQALNDAGIPGLRYLDGTSRSKGEGSANYVIWDENLLTPEKAQITPYYSKRDKPKPKVTGARPEELIEVRKQISSFRTLIKCLGG